jgi:hypothetical protein
MSPDRKTIRLTTCWYTGKGIRVYMMSDHSADCDTGHYMLVAKVRERLAVNKQRSHIFHKERFNVRKLNEKYCIEVTHRFAVL